jgi:hypothetical protein
VLLLGGLGEVGAVLADPRLDVRAVPDLAHGEHAARLREVQSAHQLLDALPADAESLGDLGGAHQVMHDREHSYKTSGHLTSGARVGKGSHVTRVGQAMTTDLALAVDQRRCALYRHYDEDDVLLYVGITESLSDRTNSGHARTSDWVQFAVRAEAEWYDSRPLASRAERDAVQEETPVYNRQYATWDVARSISDYLRHREHCRLRRLLDAYRSATEALLAALPAEDLTEATEWTRRDYDGAELPVDDEFSAYVLHSAAKILRYRTAQIEERATVAAYRTVAGFLAGRLDEIAARNAAAQEPPF